VGTQEIAHTVTPDVLTRRDNMDVLQYVHVKKLCTDTDEPSAQVVMGTVCSQSVVDIRMCTRIRQPSIACIANAIEYERYTHRLVRTQANGTRINEFGHSLFSPFHCLFLPLL
jgi:hypothetical protein